MGFVTSLATSSGLAPGYGVMIRACLIVNSGSSRRPRSLYERTPPAMTITIRDTIILGRRTENTPGFISAPLPVRHPDREPSSPRAGRPYLPQQCGLLIEGH